MLVSSPMQPQPLMHERPSFPAVDDDDDALQAVLLASLCESVPAFAEEAAAAASAAAQKQGAILDTCTVPDRISMPVSLTGYASDATLGDAEKRELQALEDGPLHLRLLKVRGDGHCLFRAMAASLTLSAAWGGNGALSALQNHLQSLREGCADAVVHALFSLLGRTAADAGGAADALNDETLSDAAVAALRGCATAYMRQHAERFRLCCDGEDLESYCTRMEQMRGDDDSFSPVYGGHSEIVALSEVLQMKVEIVDCSGTGEKGGVPVYRLGEHLPAHAPIIYLLRKGPHYHLMLPAQSEGERVVGSDCE